MADYDDTEEIIAIVSDCNDTSLYATISDCDKNTVFNSVFHYIGSLDGGSSSANAFNLNNLLTTGKEPGDYYSIGNAGWFKNGTTGIPFFAGVNNGLVWNIAHTVDIIDSMNFSIDGTAEFIDVSSTLNNEFDIDIAPEFKTRMTNVELDVQTRNKKLTIKAAIALSGHRVVTFDGVYASQQDASALYLAGLIIQAASVNTVVEVIRSGMLIYPAGSLTPGLPLFLGIDGTLTQVPPITGWLRQIAIAIDTNTIAVDIGPAFFLGV